MPYVPKFDNTPEGKRLKKKYDALNKEQGPGAGKSLLWPGRAGLQVKKKKKPSKSRKA